MKKMIILENQFNISIIENLILNYPEAESLGY